MLKQQGRRSLKNRLLTWVGWRDTGEVCICFMLLVKFPFNQKKINENYLQMAIELRLNGVIFFSFKQKFMLTFCTFTFSFLMVINQKCFSLFYVFSFLNG